MQGHPDGQVLEAVPVRSSGGNADKGATPLRPEAASPIASSQAYERNLRLKHPIHDAPLNDGDGASPCVDAISVSGTKSRKVNRIWFPRNNQRGRSEGGKPTLRVYRRGLKQEETYAAMNVGNPSIRPARTGLPAVEVMLGSRRSHSSLRTVTPSTWRRAPVVRTKEN
jgi:hypothetical protein